MGKGRSKRKIRKFKQRGLILCEGETEKNYFKGFISQERYKRNFSSISVDIYKPKDHSPHGLLYEAKQKYSEAKKDRNRFDFIWLVFDKDGHARVPETFEEVSKSKLPINITFTVPCFEFFTLLHFNKTTKPFVKCNDVIADIVKEHIPGYKKSANLFKTLEPRHKIGMENSEWVVSQNQEDLDRGKKPYELSSYSNVHEIVKSLHQIYLE